MKKVKNDGIYPVKINEDIWFYPTAKGFSFVVWTKYQKNGERYVTQFQLHQKKIEKFILPPQKK